MFKVKRPVFPELLLRVLPRAPDSITCMVVEIYVVRRLYLAADKGVGYVAAEYLPGRVAAHHGQSTVDDGLAGFAVAVPFGPEDAGTLAIENYGLASAHHRSHQVTGLDRHLAALSK
jgi:hypothetical protein